MLLHVFDITPPLDKDGKPIAIELKMSDSLVSYVYLHFRVCTRGLT